MRAPTCKHTLAEDQGGISVQVVGMQTTEGRALLYDEERGWIFAGIMIGSQTHTDVEDGRLAAAGECL